MAICYPSVIGRSPPHAACIGTGHAGSRTMHVPDGAPAGHTATRTAAMPAAYARGDEGVKAVEAAVAAVLKAQLPTAFCLTLLAIGATGFVPALGGGGGGSAAGRGAAASGGADGGGEDGGAGGEEEAVGWGEEGMEDWP